MPYIIRWKESRNQVIDSPNLRPFQGIHRETGLESEREYTSKIMLSE